MTTTITQLLKRLCGSQTQRQPAVVEPIEGRVLMSGDSVWIDLGYPLVATPSQPTAMLLPAVQAAREAARHKVTDGTSNTILVSEAHGRAAPAGGTYGNAASYQIISAGS